MSKMYVSAEPFTVRSTYTCKELGRAGVWVYSTPSTDNRLVIFGTSAIPAGSNVQSAILTVKHYEDIGGGVLNCENVYLAPGDRQVDVTDQVLEANAGTAFSDVSIRFTFQAYGEQGESVGTKTICAWIQSAVIEITYEAGSGAAVDAQAYRAAALANERRIQPRGIVTYADGATQPITADHIKAFEINEGKNDGILLGDAVSAVLEMTLANEHGEWLPGGGCRGNRALRGAQVQMEIGLTVGGEWVYQPAGTYIIEELTGEENEAELSVTAYDDMQYKFAEKFEDTIVYPATLTEILQFIAQKTGYSLNGVLACNRVAVIPSKPDWGEECTLRQALAFVCGAGGSFAFISRDGYLTICNAWKQSPTLTLTTEDYITNTIDERSFTFNRLSVTPRGADKNSQDVTAAVSAGLEELPDNTLYIKDNPLLVRGSSNLQTMLNGIRDVLQGATWAALNCRWRGDPSVTVGTRVTLTDRRGNVITTSIMSQSLVWDQGFSMTATCSINIKQMTVGAVTGGGMLNVKRFAQESISGEKVQAGAITAVKIAAEAVEAEKIKAGAVTAVKIASEAVEAEKIKAGAVTAIKIAAEAVEAEKIKAGAVTADKIAAGAVTAAKIAAGAVTAEKIAAHTITAGLLAAGLITADSGLIATGAIGTAQIADGSITDAKIVGLTASKITAGTIDASVVYINNLTADNITTGTLNGARIPVLGTEKLADGAVTGDKVAQNAITADKIVAGAVTAAKIASAAVTTNKLAANAVTAAKIDVADLFAAQATINALNAMDIRGNQYLRLAVNRTFSQWADPALTASNNVQDGDIWNKDHGIRKWSDFGALKWSELSGYTWASFESGKQYVRKDGAWEQMNDPTGKYSIVSGIEILPQGVEISGGKYVRIRSGGVFKVDSGNFSIDSAGNVKMKGTVEAAAGKIGGWTIGADKLSSGDGTNYVQMAVSGDYAFLAGNATESSAPFRVKRDGTVYLTKLVALNEQGGETTVNLQNYPFWKLGYHTIKSYNANGITLSNGATINFNTAAQLIIEGSWSGMTFTATVKNGSNQVVMSTSESFSGGKGTGLSSQGSVYTIDAFDSAHRAHGYVNASPHFQPGRLFTFNVDASGEYNSGVASVTIPYANITRSTTDQYNPSTHNTTISVQVEASNGAMETRGFVVSGADAYKDGNNDAYANQTVIGTCYIITAHSGDWVKVQEVGTGYSRVPYMN